MNTTFKMGSGGVEGVGILAKG